MSPAARRALAQRLRQETRADILFGEADRGRYATDASIYQVMPEGVIAPRDADDVEAALAICREFGTPLLARGAGTSQCGQTVNRALVVDCSRHMRRLLAVDTAAGTAEVEPGLVLGQLNAALKPHGLFFPIDPSTHARCTIGGMAGNNSCGGKSLRYGLMADQVLAIDALLPSGTRHRFGLPAAPSADAPAEIATLTSRLLALGEREAEEIAARFPRQLRRVGGYNIDCLTPAADADGRRNLARLLVGSEGTLAFFTRLTLRLSPVKPRRMLGICQFPSFRRAMETVRPLLALDPESIELVDRTMIDLGRASPLYRPTLDRMLIGEPEALLLVEFHGHEDAPLAARLDRLEELMADLGLPHAVVRAADPTFQSAVAAVREAGLNIMMSMKGDGKPVSFIEDCAVDLADLPDYTERLNAVFARHGTRGTWYAHASVGCLHVRPVLNMKDPADVSRMRAIAEECFALVRDYKGSHSGEHGDGISRSEFHPRMFGTRIASAFAEVKHAFDPASLLNPGRIVDPPRMDDRTLFRYSPEYAPLPDMRPQLDWSAWPGAPGGLLGAVEMCNNNGACRSFDAEVMCPSYRVTRDEAHLTRGRANTLRLALTGQIGPGGLASPALAEAMELCVSCKACRRECPTGVDMAKMKIEVLAARAARHGVRLRERLVAELPRFAPVAEKMPAFANAAQRLAAPFVGFAASRRLPAFVDDPFRDREAAAEGDVLLFADCFNRHFEPANLRSALNVLRAAGLSPAIARTAGRPLCCGRTYLAAGMVGRARAEANRTLAALRGGKPVLGLEPSCLFTLKDEFPSLLPGPEARELADRVFLVEEFLASRPLPLAPLARTAHVHGHCHQKSFGAFASALATLRSVPGLRVKPIASSCCGGAGSFGYHAETQEVSKAMAEASLLPAVRAAAPDDLILASGTSCRQQIRDLAGREALHPVRVLEMALCPRK